MGTANRRALRPVVDHLEGRELPSGIIAALANHPLLRSHPAVPGISTTQIPDPGPPTPRELARERFVGTFSGPFTMGPARFQNQKQQIYIRAAGTSKFFLHGDIQLNVVTSKDPSAPLTGTLGVFDRNLSAGSTIIADVSTDPNHTDRFGRPTRLDWSFETGSSSGGAFGEASGQGTMKIRYFPEGDRPSQGLAAVKMTGSIVTLGTTYVLRNADIDP
jgi:hypothetical protein